MQFGEGMCDVECVLNIVCARIVRLALSLAILLAPALSFADDLAGADEILCTGGALLLTINPPDKRRPPVAARGESPSAPPGKQVCAVDAATGKMLWKKGPFVGVRSSRGQDPFGRLELAAEFIPAREIGGDYYDVIPLDESRLAVCLGDVMGKGVPAALLVAKADTPPRSCHGLCARLHVRSW